MKLHCLFVLSIIITKKNLILWYNYHSQTPAEPEEKAVVATETETETEAEPAPAPAESTGPTVNIQTAEAAKAEPVHAAAELAVKTMSAGRVVVLHRDSSDNSSGDPPADSVNREKSVSPGSTPSLEQVQQGACVKAEVQPAAETTLGFNEGLSDGSSSPESAGLILAAERGSKEVIDEEGEDAGVKGEAPVSKHKSDVFNFTVNPAFIRGSEKEEEQSTEEEAVGRCVEALEDELTGLKPTRQGKQKETDGKRVQFSDQVEYFEEEEIPRELQGGIEEVDEEAEECSQTGDEGQNTLKPLPFEKEKYHHEQMESSEEEVEREEEEEEMSAKGEDEDDDGENNCDVMVSEEEEDMKPSPCDVTQSEPPPSPQAPAQSEVTPQGPPTPRPLYSNLTTHLHCC